MYILHNVPMLESTEEYPEWKRAIELATRIYRCRDLVDRPPTEAEMEDDAWEEDAMALTGMLSNKISKAVHKSFQRKSQYVTHQYPYYIVQGAGEMVYSTTETSVLAIHTRIHERRIKDSGNLAEYVAASWEDYNALCSLGHRAHPSWILSVMMVEIGCIYPEQAQKLVLHLRQQPEGGKTKWEALADGINEIAEKTDPAGQLVFAVRQETTTTPGTRPENKPETKSEDKSKQSKSKGREDSPAGKKSGKKKDRQKNTKQCPVCGKTPKTWDTEKYHCGNGCFFCHTKAVDEIVRQHKASQQPGSMGAFAPGAVLGKSSMVRATPVALDRVRNG